MAIHRPAEFTEVSEVLCSKDFYPQWVVIENQAPDPNWCRLLEATG
jgi:hypothetical protein